MITDIIGIEKLKSLKYKEHSDSEEDMTTDDDMDPWYSTADRIDPDK